MSESESKKPSEAKTRLAIPWGARLGPLFVGASLGLALGIFLGDWRSASDEALVVESASEMEEQMRMALREVSAFSRALAVGRVLRSLDGENVAGAARAMRVGADYLDPIVSQLFLSAWAEFDAMAAMEEARTWPAAAPRELGMRTTAREWAASGRYLEAVNYYQSLDDSETRSILLAPLLRGWAQSGDVEGALDRTRMAWERFDRPEAAADGFARGALAALGPEAMADRISELPETHADGFERRLVLTSIRLISNERPDQAARLYAHFSAGTPPDWIAGGLDLIAEPWSLGNPRAAIDWLLEQADRPQRTVALKNAMRTWTLQDLDEAWGWWQEQVSEADAGGRPRPALRSILLAPTLRTLARARPVEAAQWVDQVGRPGHRQVLVQRIAHFWAQQDPHAASTWVLGLGLSAENSAAAEAAIAAALEKRGESAN